MLSDVMDYFGLGREFDEAGYFETEHHRYLAKEIVAAIKKGRIITLTGIVGCGKTKVLRHIRKTLKKENAMVVAHSLAVDKEKVNLVTLMRAITYGFSTDDNPISLPKQPEDREHRVIELIRKHGKPTVLFIDDAHGLHTVTLAGLKRLMEAVRDEGEILSIVLAGHPKLHNDLRRPTEEIGARTELFTLEGIQGRQYDYIQWLLAACAKNKSKPETFLAEEAQVLLAERLVTPLQIEQYLGFAFEKGFHIAQKPVTVEVVESVLARDLDDPEPRLIRHGYNAKVLAQALNIRPAEVRAFLRGQLPTQRTQELKHQLLIAGVPV